MRVTSKIPLIVAGAIGAGAILAFALPASADPPVQSQSPPAAEVTLAGRAALDADGAVAFAPVSIVCRPGSYAFITVTITESVNGDIAGGQTYSEIECTGKTQRMEIAINPTQKAFRNGVAFGQAKLQVCTDRCHTAVSQHNIQLVARR